MVTAYYVETLIIMRFLGGGSFMCCIKYFVIAVGNKQYEISKSFSWGPEKIVQCYNVSSILLYQIFYVGVPLYLQINLITEIF